MGARQSTLNHTIAKSLNNEEETHTQISFHNVQMHTHIFSHSDLRYTCRDILRHLVIDSTSDRFRTQSGGGDERQQQ